MKRIIMMLLFLSFSLTLFAQGNRVITDKKEDGWRLLVDGEPFMVNGMNWDYFPIGTNYMYSLWEESDDFIRRALDNEMSLLQNMGVNAIRVYTGIQPKWVQYIYENYGIYTMLNHSFGRYGLTLDGVWTAVTKYDDPATQELLLSEVTQMVEEYKDTPGLLLYLLGNENNYGLFWAGAETEDFPEGEEQINAVGEVRGRPMYQLMNEASIQMKAVSASHPVAICNGDLLFMDIIAEECPDVDIFGINVYRGPSFTDMFDRVRDEYGKPILLTEFGSDAFNAITLEEAQRDQAIINVANWKEIYENAAGLGKAENSLGGFTFQFSDGWWKYGQTVDLDVHNTNASWENGGYAFDHIPGENNMNEEWFGICAKGPTNVRGHYDLFPRAAYYALKEAHKFDPYAEGANLYSIQSHFAGISIGEAYLQARGDRAALEGERSRMVRLSRFSAELSTFNTGGSLITTPDDPIPGGQTFPNQLGFDDMQSFFIGFEANPTPNFHGNVEVNVLGNVAQNPIDEIFYENRGRAVQLDGPDGDVNIESLNRVQVYRASYRWDHRWFKMDGFYRTGRYHWGYEGDFFGLYPEANYGPNIDIYNGIAPFGFEVEGKRQLKNLKLAFGPQLWWGANPAFLLKYGREFGGFDLTGIYHEDLDQLGITESSFAIPQPKTRRVTLHVNREFGSFGVDVGGIWAGQPLQGREFQVYREDDVDQNVYIDEIKPEDNWGGKIKLTYTGGRFNWYAQSAIMGLVAQGGVDQTLTFTGWRLKDSGSGNQVNFLTGVAYNLGNLQIAPNFLWQRPLEGPIPSTVPAPGRPRNILTDPFVVRANREQVAGELLLTYDPTPGTWMYDWDSDRTEDARLAFSLGFIYRHLPTTMDAAIGILPDGRTTFAFPGAPPARDLWEVYARVVSKLNSDYGLIANIYGGEAQSNGSDDRTIYRYGMELRSMYKSVRFSSFVRINDWGPYDYHRDFNLTFPLQLMGDISFSLGRPDWLDIPNTRIGLRGKYRNLDRFSPRYSPTQIIDDSGDVVPEPEAIGFDRGNEWEIKTYILINIGN